MESKVRHQTDKEAELYRDIVINQADHIELLKRNIREMQGQIQHGYKRIDQLIKEKNILEEEVEHLRNRYQPTEGC